MKENIVAVRYAQALFEEAKAEGKTQEVITQIGALSALYDASEDFKILVKNPLITKQDKQTVIDGLKEKGAIDGILYQFITLMTAKNRLSLLKTVAEQVLIMDMRDRGEAEALVTVAASMDEASRKALKEVLDKITGKKVTIKEQIDASILGGVIAQVESSLYDASIKGQLNKIKEELI